VSSAQPLSGGYFQAIILAKVLTLVLSIVYNRCIETDEYTRRTKQMATYKIALIGAKSTPESLYNSANTLYWQNCSESEQAELMEAYGKRPEFVSVRAEQDEPGDVCGMMVDGVLDFTINEYREFSHQHVTATAGRRRLSFVRIRV
jgi:hypothetical protein